MGETEPGAAASRQPWPGGAAWIDGRYGPVEAAAISVLDLGVTRSSVVPARPISDLAWPLCRGSAPEEGGEPVAGAGRSRHGDWRREQGVPAGAGDQHRGYRQQVDGQGARDRLALPACPGYVPPVDGDLEGCRSGHDAGRQRAAGDVDDLALVAGAGPGVQQRQARSRNARAGSAARSPSSAAGSSPTRPASMPSPNAARDSQACRSSIRRSHSRHGVGRDRSSGVTARTTPSA